jgi:hypothetical protein
MKYLLDVNVLIAAININHPDHVKADEWIEGKHVATCALSELGFLRVTTNPKALNVAMPIARRVLAAFLERQQAEFVPADLPALKSHAGKSEEVTDCYLAELAASKGMKLATLDTGIWHAAAELIS